MVSCLTSSKAAGKQAVTGEQVASGLPEFVPGQDYEVVYKIWGVHRKPRKARMGYLGPGTMGLQFDARGPNRSVRGQYAGTQELKPRWIISAVPVDRVLAARYVNVPAQGKDNNDG